MKFDIFLTDIDQLLPKILVNVIFFPMLLADLECHAIFFSLYFIFPFILKKKNQEHEGNVWDCIWHIGVAFRDLEYDNACGSSNFMALDLKYHVDTTLVSI